MPNTEFDQDLVDFRSRKANIFLVVFIFLVTVGFGVVWPFQHGTLLTHWQTPLFCLIVGGGVVIHNIGSLRYWWKNFWGYEVTIDPTKWTVEPSQRAARVQEMQAWVKDQNSNKIYEINSTRYQFFKKSDAVLFKLTWR